MLQSKGKQFTKDAEAFALHAVDGETVLASLQIGMSTFILTNFRLVRWALSGGVKSSYPLNEIESYRSESSKLGVAFFVTLSQKPEEKLGVVFEDIASDFELLLKSALDNSESTPGLRAESRSLSAERYAQVPSNRRKGNFPSHLTKAIEKNARTGEDPVMIISGQYDSTEGSLIVFADRCVISKSGLLAGFMTGSLGGSRDATFFLKDITGIEYNSGMLSGVLEILTASYDGSPNKDFWTGVLNPNRNTSLNDPRALSNTLPLTKVDYLSAKPLIDSLRDMIRESKETKVVVNVESAVSAPSAADELVKLAGLLDRGLITTEEFNDAKKKYLNG
jgi:hypothetical protein